MTDRPEGGPIVIIGAGQAAVQAIATLRQLGDQAPILLFGDEAHHPYQRPPLSKGFLSGEVSADRLELKGERFYADQGVTFRPNCRIGRIDVPNARVETVAGESVPYGRLLIATGCRPRPLPVPGAELAGVHRLRSIADVAALRAEMAPGARLVVIGGGYVGLETAAKARTLGLDVTVIEGAERLLQRVVAPFMSAFFTPLHEGRGVRILTGAGVVALEGEGHVSAVRLASGEAIPADLVLVAVGGIANAELAAEAGLAIDGGIVVDEAGRTAAPNVFAAGDVTAFPSRRYGRRIRLESVQNAVDQAKAAATAMAGQPVVYDPVPWFWSDQYDVKLQIVGLSQGHDRTTIDGAPDSGSFSVEYWAGPRLLAVDSVNAPRAHMMARRRIADASADAAAA